MAKEPKSSTKGAVVKQEATGAVSQHHRLAMGMGDGEHDPNGVGEPSTKSTVRNSPKGW